MAQIDSVQQKYVEDQLAKTVNSPRWAMVLYSLDNLGNLEATAFKCQMPEGIDEALVRGAQEALVQSKDFSQPASKLIRASGRFSDRHIRGN